jgi:hypothetical protein
MAILTWSGIIGSIFPAVSSDMKDSSLNAIRKQRSSHSKALFHLVHAGFP